MVLGIGFLLIVSLTVSALIQAAGDYSKQFIYLTPQLLEFLNFLVTFFTTSFLFGLMYRVIPEVRVDWEDVATGSVLTAILFAIGKFLIGFYLGRASVGSAYGAAGSLVVLLVWVYYSSQIFLYGAELTRVYADSRLAAESSLPAKQGTLDVNVQG
jgi:membrane protein